MGNEFGSLRKIDEFDAPQIVVPAKRKWRKYQVTQMRNGLWRAECYQPECGWYFDAMTEEGAESEVTSHAAYHGSRYKRGRNKSHELGVSHGAEGTRPDL